MFFFLRSSWTKILFSEKVAGTIYSTNSSEYILYSSGRF